MSRLFGTDGVRGVAGIELTASLAMKIGMYTSYILTRGKDNVKVLIGHDGRESADMLTSSAVAGLTSVGADVMYVGMVPTPAIAYLVKYYGYDAGIMITASHNSYEYNGIKIFDKDGYKLDDGLEDEIEKCITSNTLVTTSNIGRVTINEDAVSDYISYLTGICKSNLSSLHIAIDASNGATSKICNVIGDKLGIKYDLLNSNPNGKNINENCGSLHTDNLSKYITDNKLSGGVAFDGDGDRAIFIDEKGNVIDGDYVLAILALDLKRKNMLNDNTIVGTIMSNLGLIKFCEENDINFISTKVGDRYILEELNKSNLSLGGEQTGHTIIRKYANTGDGLLTAILVFSVLADSNKKFSEVASIMKKFPQVNINVKVSNDKKNELSSNKKISSIIRDVTSKLEGRGRVVVRPSGTEPIIRIMIEKEDSNKIEEYANVIEDVIKKELS